MPAVFFLFYASCEAFFTHPAFFVHEVLCHCPITRLPMNLGVTRSWLDDFAYFLHLRINALIGIGYVWLRYSAERMAHDQVYILWELWILQQQQQHQQWWARAWDKNSFANIDSASLIQRKLLAATPPPLIPGAAQCHLGGGGGGVYFNYFSHQWHWACSQCLLILSVYVVCFNRRCSSDSESCRGYKEQKEDIQLCHFSAHAIISYKIGKLQLYTNWTSRNQLWFSTKYTHIDLSFELRALTVRHDIPSMNILIYYSYIHMLSWWSDLYCFNWMENRKSVT